ncbi:LuxR C-terminal-related transcriptional regulator [Actinomycetospora rhizophila]|uniref:LuxR C-terminal-related transcriptional regulator n=1 Tax=Actinomycetospora rhizophila TaxID=1416876 RepID=A0ABV9ZLK9_9PSEU
MIGDGHVLFADLLSEALAERGYEEPEGVGDAEALIAEVRRRRPPVCLVDHRSLEFGRGRLLDELVAAAGGHTKVVVVSCGPAGHRGDTAGALGVDGVLDKRAGLSTLLDALRRVLDGEVVTVVAGRDGAPRSGEARRLRQRAESLTARERECLALLVDGATTEQIERTLHISVMTVRSHVRSLLRKLGAHSRLEAASLAVRYELVGEHGASRAG